MTHEDPELVEMRKLFRITEKHLLEFMECIPVKKKHLNVDSPAIFNMIMESGPQVEPMMAKLVELIKPQRVDVDFEECYKILNEQGMLSLQKVITREGAIIASPFIDGNPTWWQAYNSHTKHRLPTGMEKATLENLLNIHASLFILHYLANFASLGIGVKLKDVYKLLEPSTWIDLEDGLKTGTVIVTIDSSNKTYYNIDQIRAPMLQATQLDSTIFEYLIAYNIHKLAY